MATPHQEAELSGIVQIDVDREISTTAVSDGLTQIIDRILTFSLVKDLALPPSEIRKRLKAKEKTALDRLTGVLTVTDDESCDRVGALVLEANRAIKEIGAEVEADKSMASALHKRICDREAVAQFPHQLVKQAGDVNINIYRLRQRDERLRQEREDTEKAAAESRRLQALADAAAAEQRKLEAAAAEAKRQGDMKAARAMQQQAAAVVEQVEVLTERAEIAKEVVHEAAAPAKVAGRTESFPWVGKGVNVMDLIQAIACGQFPLFHEIPVRGGGTVRVPILNFDDSVIQHYAKRLEANARIPGCEFKEEIKSSYRAK